MPSTRGSAAASSSRGAKAASPPQTRRSTRSRSQRGGSQQSDSGTDADPSLRPTRRSRRHAPTVDSLREADNEEFITPKARPRESTSRRLSASPYHRNDSPFRLRMRASIGAGGVQVMPPAQRFETLQALSLDFIAKFYMDNELKGSFAEPSDDVQGAWQMTHRFLQSHLFSEAELFPTANEVFETLPPRARDELGEDARTSIAIAGLANFIWIIAYPDAATKLLPKDRKGKGKARLNEEYEHARRRTDLLFRAWKRFWKTPAGENITDDTTLQLWLDFATQIIATHPCPTIDPLTAPDTTFPHLPERTTSELFWTSAAVFRGCEPGEDESVTAQVKETWTKLVNQRAPEVNQLEAEETLRRYPYDNFRERMLLFIKTDVIDGGGTPQSSELGRVFSQEDTGSDITSEATDHEVTAEEAGGFDIEDMFKIFGDVAMELDHEAEPAESPAAEEDEAEWAVKDGPPLRLGTAPTLSFNFAAPQADAVRVEWDDSQPASSRAALADRSSAVTPRKRTREDADATPKGPPPPPPAAADQADDESDSEDDIMPPESQMKLVVDSQYADPLPFAGTQESPPDDEDSDDDSDEDLMPSASQLAALTDAQAQPTEEEELEDSDSDEDIMPSASQLAGLTDAAVHEEESSDEEDIMPSASQLGFDDEELVSPHVKLEALARHEGDVDDQDEENLYPTEGEMAEEEPAAHEPQPETQVNGSSNTPRANGTALGTATARQRARSYKRGQDLMEFATPEPEDVAEQERLELAHPSSTPRSNRRLTGPRMPRRSSPVHKPVSEADQFINDEEPLAEVADEAAAMNVMDLQDDHDHHMRQDTPIQGPPNPLRRKSPPPDPYLCDERGYALAPDARYVIPPGHEFREKKLHGRIQGQTYRYSRITGARRWTNDEAILLYRTIQRVPVSELHPCQVAWYLHGEDGVLTKDLRFFNPQHMKDKMRTIVATRDQNNRKIYLRARKFLPPKHPLRIEYEEELAEQRRRYDLEQEREFAAANATEDNGSQRSQSSGSDDGEADQFFDAESGEALFLPNDSEEDDPPIAARLKSVRASASPSRRAQPKRMAAEVKSSPETGRASKRQVPPRKVAQRQEAAQSTPPGDPSSRAADTPSTRPVLRSASSPRVATRATAPAVDSEEDLEDSSDDQARPSNAATRRPGAELSDFPPAFSLDDLPREPSPPPAPPAPKRKRKPGPAGRKKAPMAVAAAAPRPSTSSSDDDEFETAPTQAAGASAKKAAPVQRSPRTTRQSQAASPLASDHSSPMTAPEPDPQVQSTTRKRPRTYKNRPEGSRQSSKAAQEDSSDESDAPPEPKKTPRHRRVLEVVIPLRRRSASPAVHAKRQTAVRSRPLPQKTTPAKRLTRASSVEASGAVGTTRSTRAAQSSELVGEAPTPRRSGRMPELAAVVEQEGTAEDDDEQGESDESDGEDLGEQDGETEGQDADGEEAAEEAGEEMVVLSEETSVQASDETGMGESAQSQGDEDHDEDQSDEEHDHGNANDQLEVDSEGDAEMAEVDDAELASRSSTGQTPNSRPQDLTQEARREMIRRRVLGDA